MLLKIKGDRAFEVDMGMCDWGNVAHMAFRAVPVRAFGGLLVLMRVPDDDDVGEQCERTGDGGHLLARSASSRRDRARVYGTLPLATGSLYPPNLLWNEL